MSAPVRRADGDQPLSVAAPESVDGVPWWRGAVIYQAYIRSFADGTGDGVGDLVGLRTRVPYLKYLGVDAVWITPCFRSPMVDHGYDVADPRDIDPLFGSIDDIDALIDEAHSSGLRVIIEIVPNHTSDRHEWFQEALESPPGSFARDRYLFRPPGPDGGLPNNWRSVFGGPAWTLDERSGEYWLHLFAPEQPDLNWRNPEVQEDAERTLRFWLDRGVDGFRIDVAHGLFKAAGLPDNPEWPDPPESLSDFGRMEQKHTFDQPEVHETYRRWRAIADGYEHQPVLLGEVFLWDPARVARYTRPDELHLAFSFLLLGQQWDAEGLRRAIELCIGGGHGATTTAWVLSNHDLARHTTRYGGGDGGRRRARAAALLLLGLPGTSVIYQGEELGLEDVHVSEDDRQDPIWFRSGGEVAGRDGCRTPFPWTCDGPSFGFSEAADCWLPVPADWGKRSVEAQQGDPASMLELYREALRQRHRLGAIRHGGFRWLELAPGVLAFERRAGSASVTVVVNVTGEEVAVPVAGRLVLVSDDGVRRRANSVVLPTDSAAWVAG